MAREGQFFIEESGFTPEEYKELKAKKVKDSHIYENILFVSKGAFREWKLRHNLTGTKMDRSTMDDNERIRINNTMRKHGYNGKEIYSRLKLTYESYLLWKMRMRKKGFEVT